MNATLAADVAEAEGTAAAVSPQEAAALEPTADPRGVATQATEESRAEARAEQVQVTPVPTHAPVATPLPEAPAIAPAAPAAPVAPAEAAAAPAEHAAAQPAAPAAPAPVAAEPESALTRLEQVEPVQHAQRVQQAEQAQRVEHVEHVEHVDVVETAPAPAPAIEPTQVSEPEPAVSTEPVATAVSAPVEAASAVTEVAHRPAAFEAAVASRPRANGLPINELQPMLESAGLVWVNTDADKLRAAREAAAQAPAPVRAARERKPLPNLDHAPMQQVETRKDA